MAKWSRPKMRAMGRRAAARGGHRRGAAVRRGVRAVWGEVGGDYANCADEMGRERLLHKVRSSYTQCNGGDDEAIGNGNGRRIASNNSSFTVVGAPIAFALLATEVILQVHHRNYVKGRLPWEYPCDECEVLCRGCHAKEHGIIKPSKDWELIGQDDLGGLDGACEHCGTELRYTHMVTHPNWGVMIVGAVCCDKLTESTIGSDGHAEFLNYINRRKAFIDSPKWIATPNGVCTIKRAGIVIEIVPAHDGTFRFNLDDVKGKVGHATLLDAKFSVFDYVDSGKAAGYLAERRCKVAERTAAKGCVIVDT